jgi:hypothetical protein
MQCIQGLDDHCGGTADRLKPFLFLLREAHVTKRILLIYWTRPAKLEEFLVPPRGGLDWRAPTWLQPIVSEISRLRVLFMRVSTHRLDSLERNQSYSWTIRPMAFGAKPRRIPSASLQKETNRSFELVISRSLDPSNGMIHNSRQANLRSIMSIMMFGEYSLRPRNR